MEAGWGWWYNRYQHRLVFAAKRQVSKPQANGVGVCTMAKVVRVQHGELERALEQGAEYLIVGNRRFFLVEIREEDADYYDVTDPEEMEIVQEALDDDSPLLGGKRRALTCGRS